MNKYKTGAMYRSIQWNLTFDDIANVLELQEYKCALSGIPITATGNFETITASIDRIDNSRGYEPGNIQVVHKRVNMARGSLTVEEFVDMCRLVAQHRIW